MIFLEGRKICPLSISFLGLQLGKYVTKAKNLESALCGRTYGGLRFADFNGNVLCIRVVGQVLMLQYIIPCHTEDDTRYVIIVR